MHSVSYSPLIFTENILSEGTPSSSAEHFPTCSVNWCIKSLRQWRHWSDCFFCPPQKKKKKNIKQLKSISHFSAYGKLWKKTVISVFVIGLSFLPSLFFPLWVSATKLWQMFPYFFFLPLCWCLCVLYSLTHLWVITGSPHSNLTALKLSVCVFLHFLFLKLTFLPAISLLASPQQWKLCFRTRASLFLFL